MAFITLDFETHFRSAKNRGTPGPNYSLKNLTYEDYLNHPEYKTHGVGIKENDRPTEWYPGAATDVLQDIFAADNKHTLLCHNTMFDAAILCWVYGLKASSYYCTQSMSRALWNQERHSLSALAERCFPNDETMRKGKELETVDGIRNPTPEQLNVLGGYCIQDVDLTFACFAEMYKYFPDEELKIMDLTIKMFAERMVVPNRQGIIEYKQSLIDRQKDLIKNCRYPKGVLSSNQQFAEAIKRDYGIVIPEKHSPTPKNPHNTTLALAKDDLEFIKIRHDHPELDSIWDARLAVKSVLELSRCDRFLNACEVTETNPRGELGIPLTYCTAVTKRWGGTNKINMQNLGRGSYLRRSLEAPEGFLLNIRDLSNIEGRMNAWFNGQTDKLGRFAAGADEYNLLGADIYGYPIDRKLKRTNEQGQYLTPEGTITDDKDDADLVYGTEGFVAKQAELGLGYNMGGQKFGDTLAKQGLLVDSQFANRVVGVWRQKNYKIVAGWKKADQVIRDMQRRDLVPYMWGCVRVERNRIALPNGLYLTYPGLNTAFNDDTGYTETTYWEGKFWKNIYGGLLIENIIQAISRIVLTHQLLCIIERCAEERLFFKVALLVHDEIVAITKENESARVDEIMAEEMAKCPPWCNDGSLVLASEGGISVNYSK